MSEALILLPGIMGSQLWQDSHLIWPGSPAELFLPYGKMAQLLDPDLKVGDVIRSVSISVQYQHLIDVLALCGFSEEGAQPTLRLCPYDWRKDNAQAAGRLATAVQQVRTDHGPDVDITLLAHSMGGLVARYFLESGRYAEANCAGFDNIRRLLTVGTPHRGAPLALCAALGQVKRLFLSADQVKAIASRPEFPALYQLMPPPGEPFLWDTTPDARLADKSPYDEAVMVRLGLSAANVESARSFHAALDVARRPAGVPYFCFVGTRQPTLANVQGAFTGADTRVRGVEVSDAGDGTVPSWSASFAGMQQLAVGGEHGTLYQVPEVQRTMGALLGKAGVLAIGLAPEYRLTLSVQVAVPEQRLQLAILGRQPHARIEAQVVVEKLAGTDGAPLAAPVEVARHPVTYSGADVDSLSLVVAAPKYAGIYAYSLRSQGARLTEEDAQLLVQNQ
jgi:phospholipase A1